MVGLYDENGSWIDGFGWDNLVDADDQTDKSEKNHSTKYKFPHLPIWTFTEQIQTAIFDDAIAYIKKGFEHGKTLKSALQFMLPEGREVAKAWCQKHKIKAEQLHAIITTPSNPFISLAACMYFDVPYNTTATSQDELEYLLFTGGIFGYESAFIKKEYNNTLTLDGLRKLLSVHCQFVVITLNPKETPRLTRKGSDLYQSEIRL